MGDERGAMFEGTPDECVAWLDTHFSMMGKIVEGAKSVADESARADFDEMLDALGRSVYRVTVEPIGMVAKHGARDEWLPRVTRLRTGLELFDALVPRPGPTIPDE